MLTEAIAAIRTLSRGSCWHSGGLHRPMNSMAAPVGAIGRPVAGFGFACGRGGTLASGSRAMAGSLS